jgi:very-short-patch-repair endonuclease
VARFPFLKGTSRLLRPAGDDASRILWRLIRKRQPADAKFRRNAQFDGCEIDFLCPRYRLAILIEGARSERAALEKQAAHLESYGFRVLRLDEAKARDAPEAAWAQIDRALAVGE